MNKKLPLVLTVLLAGFLVIPAFPTGADNGLTEPIPARPLQLDPLSSWQMEPGSDAMAQAYELAQLSFDLQADQIGFEPVAPPALQGHERLTVALEQLASTYDISLDDETVNRLQALDEYDPEIADALMVLVDAFILLIETVERTSDARHGTSDWDPAIALLVAARGQVLDQGIEFREAIQQNPPMRSECEPIVAPPAFALDLEGCDSLYVDHVALSVDIGGDDTYHNNAGGNRVITVCESDLTGEIPAETAALFDFGSGSDVYGNQYGIIQCGANGGAYDGGVGMLIDDGGNDEYWAWRNGVNGGGHSGTLIEKKPSLGFLLDASGDDFYLGLEYGANGGGAELGIGLLIDALGNDQYFAVEEAVNGASYTGGIGMLVDGDGDDWYDAHHPNANGAGEFSPGALIDLSGTDRYVDPAIPDGSCYDCSIVPKGLLGVQMDL